MKLLTQHIKTSTVAAIVTSFAFILTPVVHGQSQDATKSEQGSDNVRKDRDGPRNRAMRGRELDTIAELPDGTQTLTLKNGNELYFHDGQLYRFAESRSAYVLIPGDTFTGRNHSRAEMGRRIKRAGMRHKRQYRAHNDRLHHRRR